jgi:ribonuclease BN (tRNA processing enzyme)
MARVTFLGTASALPTPDRSNTALAVQTEETAPALLVDCGGDVYRALLHAGLGQDAVSDLAITHAHIDHIGTLPSLVESLRLGGRTAPLRIWALPQVLEIARRLIGIYDFELTLDRWSFDVSFHEARPGEEHTLAGIATHFVAMDHAIPSVGLRMEMGGHTVAYTCDTQPNPNISELGTGVELLITECTFVRGEEAYARMSKHMTAYEVGQAAAACGAGKLAIVHLGEWSEAEARAEIAESFKGTLIIPNDGDVVTL